MIQLSADFLFALEAIEEHRVALHLGMRNLDGHGAAGPRIRGRGRSKPCRCARPSSQGNNDRVVRQPGVESLPATPQLPVFELMDELKRTFRVFAAPVQPGDSGQFVRPPPIHANPFDAPNANQLKAHIIAAVALVGKLHQLPRLVCRSALSPNALAWSASVTAPCRPSVHNNRISPASSRCSLTSALTNRSFPSERLSTWRLASLRLAR